MLYIVYLMDENFVKEIIKKLESKDVDCMAFSKKHKSRGNDDLVNYYDGASWALKFVISIIKETDYYNN
jgi:hypothetical protein